MSSELDCDVLGNKDSYFACGCSKFQVPARSIGEAGKKPAGRWDPNMENREQG